MSKYIVQNGQKIYMPDIEPEGAIPIFKIGSDVATRKVKWLWTGRFPLRGLSLLAGNPGVGKSHLSLYMAATVTNGDRWPDGGEKVEQGSVVILTAEDSLEETMSLRLRAAGADMTRIMYLIGAKTSTGLLNIFALPDFARLLYRAIKAWRADVSMVIIDPITAYMGGKDANSNTEVRGFLAPLAMIADEMGVAIIGISHMNKDMSKMAIHRMLGSTGFTAAARAVWLVMEDPEEEERRLFLAVKVNQAKKPTGLAYSLITVAVPTDDGPTLGSACVFESIAVNQTADEIMAETLTPFETKLGAAKKWLKDALMFKAVPKTSLIADAKKAKIAKRTLDKAREAINVEEYGQKLGENRLIWMWRLPKGQK